MSTVSIVTRSDEIKITRTKYIMFILLYITYPYNNIASFTYIKYIVSGRGESADGTDQRYIWYIYIYVYCCLRPSPPRPLGQKTDASFAEELQMIILWKDCPFNRQCIFLARCPRAVLYFLYNSIAGKGKVRRGRGPLPVTGSGQRSCAV